MAVTVAAVAYGNFKVKRITAGHLESWQKTVTMDSSYLTGGEPVTAAQMGLSRIIRAYSPIILTSTGAVGAFVTRIVPIIQTNGSLLLRAHRHTSVSDPTVIEVANTADLSGVSMLLTVEGY